MFLKLPFRSAPSASYLASSAGTKRSAAARMSPCLTLLSVAGSALVCLIGLTACSEGSHSTAQVTPQGTVQLENLKAGMPQTIFEDAQLTFVKDPSPAASFGGKTQFVSRSYDPKGGQYMAQCKDNRCFLMQVLYKTNPITKEEAIAQMKQLLPTDAPAEFNVNPNGVKGLKEGKAVELYEFGDKYVGMLAYDDTGKTKVSDVYAWAVNKAQVKDMIKDAEAQYKKGGGTESASGGSDVKETPQTAADDSKKPSEATQ